MIMKSIEKKMENRYRTAGSFLKALENANKTEDPSGGYWKEQDLY